MKTPAKIFEDLWLCQKRHPFVLALNGLSKIGRLFFSLALILFSTAVAESSKPNIIFILVDDMGYGDVGAYGCEDIRTPNLDRLAETGVMLTDGYVTHPFCGPSRAGIMTGRYQQRHGFRANPAHQRASIRLGLDLEEETMADVLSRAGYHTAAIGKWHLGSSSRFHPNNRGFNFFFGFISGGRNYFPASYEGRMRSWVNMPNPPVAEMYGYAEPLEINGIEVPPPNGYLTDILTTQAIGVMRQKKEAPLFLYIAYNAPHTPLEAPEETIAAYADIEDKNRRIYAAMVDNLDMNVGRILDELEKQDKRDNTLVVFLSDNGGLLGYGGASNGPLAKGKGMVEEGGIRVPFIWNWPAGLPRGMKVSAPISALDLLPTFAALAAVEPQGKPLDGVNVLPWLRGEAEGHPHQFLAWLSHETKQGIRMGDFKAIRTRNGPWRLYDLSTDIGEKNNLARTMPEKTAELAKTYERWLAEMPPALWNEPVPREEPLFYPLLSGQDLVEQYK